MKSSLSWNTHIDRIVNKGKSMLGVLQRNLQIYSRDTIRIYHECEDDIEKSVLRITVCHQEACRVLTNGDHEGQIFLSHPHTNHGFFSLLVIEYSILFKKAPRSY